MFSSSCLSLLSTAVLVMPSPGVMQGGEEMLFNFNSESEFGSADIDEWYESSDTVRSAGMSKAVFSLQKSKVFQRAVMFALINPQPNGAGFAGVKRNVSLAEHDGREGVVLRGLLLCCPTERFPWINVSKYCVLS